MTDAPARSSQLMGDTNRPPAKTYPIFAEYIQYVQSSVVRYNFETG